MSLSMLTCDCLGCVCVYLWLCLYIVGYTGTSLTPDSQQSQDKVTGFTSAELLIIS